MTIKTKLIQDNNNISTVYNCFFFLRYLQIDDIKLIRDHETNRSQGYGFITVSTKVEDILPTQMVLDSIKDRYSLYVKKIHHVMMTAFLLLLCR